MARRRACTVTGMPRSLPAVGWLVAVAVAATAPGTLAAASQHPEGQPRRGAADVPESPGRGLFAQSPFSVTLLGANDPLGPRPVRGPAPGPIEGPGQGEAFLSSLVLPGLSQHRLGTRRWIAYAGVEVVAAFLYIDRRAEARELRASYRDFAWQVARLGLSAEPRQDGDFDYYETLSKWMTSGAWDADAALDGLQPELDPSTYNGSVWALAAEIFDLDPAAPERSPGFPRALDYYRDRGYGPPFLWAWREGTGDQARFGGLITSSDDRFRDARQALWMLAANHLISAVDGFITARLRLLPHTGEVGVILSANVP